jgi:hypothetical protein
MNEQDGLTPEELAAEGATALPDKEVVSILDLNADLDLAIDAAAPIDLAVAANANVAAPIDAAAAANVLSEGSTAQALGDQGAMVTQNIEGDASAAAQQDSVLDQSDDTVGGEEPAAATTTASTAPSLDTDPTLESGADTGTVTDGVGDAVGDTTGTVGDTVGDTTGTVGDTVDDTTGTVDDTVDDTTGTVDDTEGGVTDDLNAGALDGNLLNVNVDLAADADIAAPINGAVGANANVAAPINAGVAANIGSVDSEAVAVSQQDAIIDQNIEGDATAESDQQSDIQQ